MRSLWEHVDGLDFLGFVTEGFKDGEVAGEAGGITGYVDDALGLHFGEGLQDERRASRARRVDDDDVGAHTLPVELRHDACRVADEELRVLDVIVARIALRIFDGWLHDLDAVDLRRFLCEEQADGSRPAVRIDDGLPAAQVCELESLAVKDFGLFGVHLEKGAWGNMEFQPPDAVENGRLTPKQFRLPPHDDVVVVGLDILLHADEVRQFGAEEFDEFPLARQMLRRCDQADHEFLSEADAANNMAQYASMPILIIDGDMELRRDIPHSVDDSIVPLFLNMAVLRIDDTVRAARKASDDGSSLFKTNRKLHLIAIVPRRYGADGRLDIGIWHFANARDRIDDLLALHLELGHIVEVLELAAAAIVIDGADWLHAVGTLAHDLEQPARRVALFDLFDLHADLFTGQRAAYEHGKRFDLADAFAGGTERPDGKRIFFSFFDRNVAFHVFRSATKNIE